MIQAGAVPKTVAIYLPDLSGGGAERLHLRLAPEFLAAGLEVTLLLDRAKGELLDSVPEGCRVDVLDARRQIAALPKLVAYLRRKRPDVLIVNMEHMNVMAILARALARVPTKIIVTQHIAFSEQVKRPSWQWRKLPAIYKRVLPHADAIVAVSAGVADDLARSIGIDRTRIEVIHNGVVGPDFAQKAAEEPNHPWMRGDGPVILSIGRMVAQKDFATLLRAFAIVSKSREARLVILGEGPLRPELEALVAELGIADSVSLPGFVDNPLPSLRQASVLVLSSRFEGFGNVVAEALACGTSCVSTDCPHGPAEILANGQFGDLVPVGEPSAMADAILRRLEHPFDADVLKMRGQDFTMARCAAAYIGLMR